MSITHVCANCGHKSSLKLALLSPSQAPVFHPETTRTEDKRVALEALKVKIKILRHAQECELAALDKELQELESDLARSSFSVLTLPNEITSSIFVECLVSSDHTAPPRVRPSPNKAPLLVSQICRHWRDVAVATCTIWSSLDLQLYRKDGAQTDAAVNLLESWFSRAKGHSLALTLRAYGQEIPLGLFTTMLSFSGQLQRLELDISENQFLAVYPMPAFPLLQTLRTRFGTRSVAGNTPMRNFVANSPQLRLLGFHPRDDDHFFPSPDVESISHLQFLSTLVIEEHVTIETFCALASLPLLTVLNCRLFNDGTHTSPTSTFPHLVVLCIDLAACAAPCNELEWLTLPGLSRLELPRGKAHPPLAVITALLARSKCTIDRLALHIEGTDMAEAPLADLFAGCPALRTLLVSTDDLTDFGPLLRALQAPGALAQLTHLYLATPVPDMGLDYEGVIALAKNRRAPQREAVLRALLVDLWEIPEEGEDDDDEEDGDPLPRSPLPGPILAAHLQEEIDGGLQFEVRFYGPKRVEVWPQGIEEKYPCLSFPCSRWCQHPRPKVEEEDEE